MNLEQLEALRILGSAVNHILVTTKGFEIDENDGEYYIPERTVLIISHFTRAAESIASNSCGWRVINSYK